jgi:hypothetical protein
MEPRGISLRGHCQHGLYTMLASGSGHNIIYMTPSSNYKGEEKKGQLIFYQCKMHLSTQAQTHKERNKIEVTK